MICLISRRSALGAIASSVAALATHDANASEASSTRLRGMLWGSLIGDAAGGPVEFKSPDAVAEWMPGAREWSDSKRLNLKSLGDLADQFRLLPYQGIRPDPAPYAHWLQNAAAGTVTDDSRHKFFLLSALRRAREQGNLPITQSSLASEYVRYQDSAAVTQHPSYGPLCEEWLHEYNQAARWVLGDRDPATAAPVERLWGGVATNAGQMALLPLAGAFAGEPAAAYRAAYRLGFMDNGTAKDLNSAIVAGLAAALGRPNDESLEDRWKFVRKAMVETDPYRYGAVPWVPRPIDRWLGFADEAATRADGSPKRLYAILEQEGQPRFHWDAHFVLASTWSILKIAQFNPLAAMQLSLDFGHDTDSTAQLVGAFIGAVAGENIFPASMRQQIKERLEADYGESVEEWTALLSQLQDRVRYPELVR